MRSTSVEQKTQSFVRLERGRVARLVREVLEDALLQVVAVVLDELARDEDEAGEPRRLARLDEPQHLGRERIRALDVLDARLGRVGDDEPERRQRRVLLDVRGQVHALDARDLLDRLDLLAVHEAPEARVVAAAAVVEDLRGHAQLVADGLDDLDRAVEPGGIVHLLNHPVNEAAQEVALAELQNLRFHF